MGDTESPNLSDVCNSLKKLCSGVCEDRNKWKQLEKESLLIVKSLIDYNSMLGEINESNAQTVLGENYEKDILDLLRRKIQLAAADDLQRLRTFQKEFQIIENNLRNMLIPFSREMRGVVVTDLMNGNHLRPSFLEIKQSFEDLRVTVVQDLCDKQFVLSALESFSLSDVETRSKLLHLWKTSNQFLEKSAVIILPLKSYLCANGLNLDLNKKSPSTPASTPKSSRLK